MWAEQVAAMTTRLTSAQKLYVRLTSIASKIWISSAFLSPRVIGTMIDLTILLPQSTRWYALLISSINWRLSEDGQMLMQKEYRGTRVTPHGNLRTTPKSLT